MSAAADVCGNCSQPIRNTPDGWRHGDTGAERCAMEFYAIPGGAR